MHVHEHSFDVESRLRHARQLAAVGQREGADAPRVGSAHDRGRVQELDDDRSVLGYVPAERVEGGDDEIVRLGIADRVEEARDDVEWAAGHLEVGHVALDESDALSHRRAAHGEQFLVQVSGRHVVAEIGEGECMAAGAAGDVEQLAARCAHELVHEPRLLGVRLGRVDLVVDAGVQPRVGVHARTAASLARRETTSSTSSSLSEGDEGT